MSNSIKLYLIPYKRVLQFIIVGGTAALLNIAILFVCTQELKIWYILSEVIAFIVALIYNFTLQKIWTFKNTTGSVLPQGLFFILINLVNLGLTTLILYCLVEFVGLWYILAQFIALVLVAFESFFVYRILFR